MTTPLVCAQSIHRLFLAFGLAALAIPALATEPASHAGMKEVTLDGLHVWLGQPVEVTKQIGWGQEWVHSQAEPSYSFIHLTPYMDRFPNGNLIVTYAMDPDTQVNPICLSAFQISSDAGRHWGRRYTTVMQHNPLIFIPKPDSDSLLGLPCELMSLSAAQPNVYAGPAYLFEHGGARMVLIPDGVKIVDWPWPVETNPGVQPPDSWHVGITLTGSAVSAEKRILATGHSFQRDAKGAKMFHNEIFASDDGGYTWRYLSTVSEYDPAFKGQPSYEGGNESYMIRLADGDLMNIFRVGGGERWKLRRSYSHDEGRTWSPADILPAWSVRPSVLRLSNGTIALTTGRPGIYLWIASDPRATHWQEIDLMAYHNAWATDPNVRIGSFMSGTRQRFQTTSYTGLVETSPNHLLMVYDRDAERKPTGPNDLSHVYVLPIEIERN